MPSPSTLKSQLCDFVHVSRQLTGQTRNRDVLMCYYSTEAEMINLDTFAQLAS